MSRTTPLIFLDGIYRINYIPLIYHFIDLEHTTIPLTYSLFSQGLDSRSFPSKICRCLQILGIQHSRFKILRKSSWIQALRSWGSGCQSGLGFKNFSSESWILNPGKFANVCKFLGFKIQDSRFWGKVLESKPLDRGVLDASQGLDSRTFPQNLESWIQEKKKKHLQIFEIQDSRFWGKVLESKPLDLGVLDASQGLDSRTFPQNRASWILGPRKFANVCIFFWIQGSRFMIISEGSMCVCVHVSVYMVIGILLYLYIYMAPHRSQPKHDPKLPPKI